MSRRASSLPPFIRDHSSRLSRKVTLPSNLAGPSLSQERRVPSAQPEHLRRRPHIPQTMASTSSTAAVCGDSDQGNARSSVLASSSIKAAGGLRKRRDHGGSSVPLKTTASPDIPIAQGPLTSEEQARIKAYLDKELRAADQEIEEIERALRVVNRAIEDNENEFKRELGRLSGPPYRPRRETGFGRSYTPLHHRIPPTPLRTPRFPSVIGDYGIDSIEARNRADEERDKSRDESNRNWEKLRKKWDRDWKKGQEEWDRAWDRWREEWDKVGNARLRRLNDRIAAEKPRLDREALYRVLLLSALVLSTAWLSAVLAAFLQSYWGGDN